MPKRILLVTADDARADRIAAAFDQARADGPVGSITRARRLAEAHARLADTAPDMLIADLHLPDGHATDLLPPRDPHDPGLPLLVLVAPDAIPEGDEAVRWGAFDRFRAVPHVLDALPYLAAASMRQWRRAARTRIAEDRLIHANRLIGTGRLAAVTAHEVGTPLNVARMQAQLLAAEPDASPALVAACDAIVGQLDLVAARLRAMLDYARSRQEAHEPLVLGEAVAQAVELLRPLAVRGGVELVVTAEPVVVRADRGRVHQVVFNLLNNALQALPGGGHVAIRTGPGERAGEAFGVVRVEDDGPGVPAAVRASIFDPFFTTKSVGHGTGLGLAVCEDLVHAHGGWIEHAEREGGGACFSFGLPLSPTSGPAGVRSDT